MAAIPITDSSTYLGAVLIFEDSTRHATLARENKELRLQVPRPPKVSRAKETARQEGPASPARRARARRGGD